MAESPSWKLASTLTTIGLAGLKYAIVLLLVMLAFRFTNASFSSAVQFELCIFMGQLPQGCS